MTKHIYKLKKDEHDDRDYLFCNFIKKINKPKPTDLRYKFVAPFDQGQEGSCTANAGAGDKMYMDGNKTSLSRQFLYNQERIIEGSFPDDAGAQMRTICKILQQYGICEESYLPYGEQNIAVVPSKESYSNAENHKISSYHRVTSIDEMKTAISAGQCVLIGITVYSSFEDVKDNGVIPMPNIRIEEVLGGHAVLLCGWKNIAKNNIFQCLYNKLLGKLVPTTQFILRNSWSDRSTSQGGWGDKGYGYINDDVLKKILQDAWVIIK